MVGGTGRTLLRMLTVGPLLGLLTRAHLGVLFVRQGPKQFEPVAKRCASGEIAVRIDRVFPLDDVAEALAWHGEGRALGKVVVAVRPACAGDTEASRPGVKGIPDVTPST